MGLTPPVRVVLVSLAAATWGWPLHRGAAQDLLGDVITDSAFRLELRPYVTLPSSRDNLVMMTTRPGDARPYLVNEQGYVYALNDNGDGTGSAAQFFNVGSALSANGRSLNSPGSSQRGLQSIAFHPDFNNVGAPGYGKLYTTQLVTRPFNTSGFNYLGDSVTGSNVNADGLLAEWTYDFNAQQVDSSSFRELFRTQMPLYDHPIKQARFNPYAVPGDDDYGLLYMTHGDSNIKHSPNDDPLHLDNALGKMIRINPLADGADPYSIPATNPFFGSGDADVLQEIYAYGFRNPHTFSFNQDGNGNVHILVGDIGRNNVEEVNLVQSGRNYGWTEREGTVVHLQFADNSGQEGYISGTDPLPGNEATLGYTYPVAQYDHDADVGDRSSGNSIATGHVIRNGSDPNLHNQLIFGDFSRRTVNNSFHADFDEMLAAITELDAGDPSRDEPSELTQATVHSLRIALDHDNNPATAPQLYDGFLAMLNDLVGSNRTDVRFGEGAFGEMYVTSKQNGVVYLVTNSVAVPGDHNADGAVSGRDFLLWQREAGGTSPVSPADGNRDDAIDGLDLDIWQSHFGATWGGGSPPAGAVPEPSTAGLVAAAALLVSWAGRRRSDCLLGNTN